MARLQVLDLSMGTLGDAGAQALLDSPHLHAGSELRLDHHYVSAPLQAALRQRYPKVQLGDPQKIERDGERYVEVSE